MVPGMVNYSNRGARKKKTLPSPLSQPSSSPRSVSSVSSPTLRQLDVVWMAHSEVSGERIVPRKRLLLGAQVAAHFLLACVVDRVFVSCEIVRPREDGVTRLARRRIYSLAFVRPVLCVPQRR